MRERGFALGQVFDNVADNFVADDLSCFESGKVSGVIAGDESFQAVGDGGARRLAIAIAHGAQDEDALKVDAAALAQESKSLHDAGVFHGCNHVISFYGGVVASPSVGLFVHLGVVPKSARRKRVATSDERRL